MIDKISPHQRKEAAQFLDACFNVLIEARTKQMYTDMSENDSDISPDPACNLNANLDPDADAVLGLGLVVDKELQVELELEFYFGVIEKAYKKFANEENVSFDDFATYMLGLMVVYIKIAEDSVDMNNKDVIDAAYKQKLLAISPENSSLSTLLITTEEGELIHKNLRLSDFPIKLIERLEIELQLVDLDVPKRDELLSNLPSDIVNWLERELIKELIDNLEREVLKDLDHRMSVDSWQVISMLIASEARIPKEVAKYIITLSDRWEEEGSKAARPVEGEPNDDVRLNDTKLEEIIKGANQKPITTLIKVIRHCIEQSIKEDKKSSPPLFFHRDSAQSKKSAAEELINALEGKPSSFSKEDGEILKRDPGFIATIGNLLRDKKYRGNLEDALISTRELKTVNSLFNHFIYLNELREVPQPPDNYV
ncbi:hypothetical protein ACQUW5_05590 [Legionella sp. CNM-1927-20]|uniref:hypothetical protein n=1 Tax=Legionella sp. CNM-1927-20 TaxID=3422221 RepID=UPI00403AACED